MIGGFRDGNLQDLLESRFIGDRRGKNHSVQMHSSLIQRLCQEKVLEGHQGCVNTISWNSKGSLLISGSDDTRINVWSYPGLKLLHSIETGHSANIFCTKFIPEISDELVASGAGDAEVRIFNLSRVSGIDGNAITPSALFQCHTRRVKKLAVEDGNPNVIWSASEDGTLRQHDLREGNSCPPAGSSQQECRNVLIDRLCSPHMPPNLKQIGWAFLSRIPELDLRSGSKRSLTDPPKGVLVLKSCDISSTKPHLILVGGSDAFARLYDRRMLPPLTSCRTRMAPPPCVNYFCPMHLSERGRSSLHLTHVTFNPNGEEVLLSYSGEHVHLFDVDPVKESEMKYGPGDASKLMKFTSMPYGLARRPTPKKHPCILSDALIEKCNKLLEYAESSLEEGTTTNYCQGIEACNEVLYRYGHDIDPSLRHKGLCRRASLFLKRKWKNDVHVAVRDSQNARKIDSSSVVPLRHISEALSQMEKHKEALEFALAARCLAPFDSNIEEWLQKLRKDIAAVKKHSELCHSSCYSDYSCPTGWFDIAEAEKNSKVNNGSPRSDTRRARVLSLGDILYRSEPNRDTSRDAQQLEREESDYVEEMEVDLEASTSGDEWRDAESNVLRGRVSLVIQQRDDSARETSPTNGSNGSTSSPQADMISYMPEVAIDMKQRYVGHCNIGTDIKQANFLGQRGEYIASGSDDGRWFIWEKRTGRLIKMLLGDEAVVNCVQCHPFDCVVATSGIDHTIKIWTPTAPTPSMVVVPDGHCICVDDPIDSNQRRLTSNREIILPFEILERFRMQELAEGNLQPFDCMQS